VTEPPELNADESYRLPVKQRAVIEDYVAELAASFVDLANAVLAPGGSISDEMRHALWARVNYAENIARQIKEPGSRWSA